MYTMTILNYAGKPVVQLPELSPLAVNQWHRIASENGYYCKLRYIGGGNELTNHLVASDQDMKQYSLAGC